MTTINEQFGSMVFSEAAMGQRLPKEALRQLMSCIREGGQLTPELADTVADAMKDWAVERGATHFCHWFQPMTGVTAEKHDSFIRPTEDGRALMDFSGKELIKGEPDASSFPSGGLRTTFEARGYTAWDPSVSAFVKDGVLCIPTAFCSYGGEALDKKTPLLRSMEALNRQSLRILRLFGDRETRSVRSTAGAEQEYFLIDRAMYNRRRDLVFTGRTLFGAKPPKGQELEDHYFGAIKPRVAAFMRELDGELWKLGVAAKTEHNEVAPGQHELAPVFTDVNTAADHNQLTMELMHTLALKHGMVCLLHEKPFEGVNGSGKHDNWSLSTDRGENLLEPGDTPAENAQFLLFLCAVIQAVNEYPEMLRIAVASAGNDHRLGANEAPPAIVSIFLGEELSAVLRAIESDSPYEGGSREQFRVGTDILPRFAKDSTDRNRTSSFAFTGNKFEFRMVGSSQSISEANLVLNTAVSDVLRRFADRLEAAPDFDAALHVLIGESVRANSRVIFDGNGYDGAWVAEAEARGLANLRTTPDALERMLDEKNVALFTRSGVLSEAELRARHGIILEGYCRMVKIEALTMSEMVRRDVLPAVSRFTGELATRAAAKAAMCADTGYETETGRRLSALLAEAYRACEALDEAIGRVDGVGEEQAGAAFCRDELLGRMEPLRAAVDEMETLTDSAFWPLPTYGDILFSVQ